MDYFSLDADFYPITSAAVGFEPYLSQILPPANEEASSHLTGNTWANPWGVIAPPSPVELTLNQTNFNSWLPASSVTQPANYGQPPYPYSGQYRSDVQAEPEPIGLSKWDGSLTARAGREPSPIPPPTSVPFVCWGGSQNGLAFGTFNTQDVHAPHQHSIDPAWTELGQTGWLQSHDIYHARGAEYVNAVAGPSSLAPSHFPSVGPPKTQPPISETTADAEKEQTGTGGDKASKSKRTKVPSGRRKPAKCRVQYGYYMHRLVRWVEEREDLEKPPTETKALAVVVKFIAEFRHAVYQKPHLRTRSNLDQKTGPVSSLAAKEGIRRGALRGSLEELSKYYPRDAGAKGWKVAELLSKVVEDLEAHQTPNDPAPGASTSTAAASEMPANLPSANSMASSPRRRSKRVRAHPRR